MMISRGYSGRLVRALLAESVLGGGLGFIEQAMFGRRLPRTMTPTPVVVDAEKTAIRRLTRQDRKPSGAAHNKKKRGWR